MKKSVKIILNGALYFLIFGIVIIGPLIILHFIYPKESSPEVWIGFIGSYLGSIVAVVGTVIVTRIQIKTERLDSLNNSLFIEHYQMLNSLLNDLYHVKNTALDYMRKVKVISRYLDKNDEINGISDYIQSFTDEFDSNQFASFYNFAKNRLTSLNFNEKEIKKIDDITGKLFANNRSLVTDYRSFNKLFSAKDADNNNQSDQFKDPIAAIIKDLGDTKNLLNELDQAIQTILKDNHDSIAYQS